MHEDMVFRGVPDRDEGLQNVRSVEMLLHFFFLQFAHGKQLFRVGLRQTRKHCRVVANPDQGLRLKLLVVLFLQIKTLKNKLFSHKNHKKPFFYYKKTMKSALP